MRYTIYQVGEKVTLTDEMKKVCVEPEKYQNGIITQGTGPWGIVEVLWNGYDHPIGMRTDEIKPADEYQ